MNPSKLDLEPAPILGENDPPADYSREEAAYQRERERLVRESLSKFALVVGDEVIGAFPTPGKALEEGLRRYGRVKMMIRDICDPEPPPDFIPLIDVNHPSVRRID
jgi:hypothetical protein